MIRATMSPETRALLDVQRARQAYASHLLYCQDPGKACVFCSGYAGQIGRAHDRLDTIEHAA